MVASVRLMVEGVHWVEGVVMVTVGKAFTVFVLLTDALHPLASV